MKHTKIGRIIKSAIKKPLVVVFAIFALLAIGIFFVVKIQNLNSKKNPAIDIVSKISDIDAKSSLAGATALVEIKKQNEAFFAQINDPEALNKKYPFLQKTFKGDVIISTPDQTIIYSPSTKSIRDISSKSIYKEIQQ